MGLTFVTATNPSEFTNGNAGRQIRVHTSTEMWRALKGVDKALAKRSACCPDEHSSQLTIFYPRTIRDQISENIRGSQVLMTAGPSIPEYHAGLPDLRSEQHLSTLNNTIPSVETDPLPFQQSIPVHELFVRSPSRMSRSEQSYDGCPWAEYPTLTESHEQDQDYYRYAVSMRHWHPADL